MTPKEKAKELFDKMKSYQMPSLRVPTMEININDTIPNAKQCALIVVDEIIEECSNWSGGGNMEWEVERYNYWQQVKNEIELL